MDEHTAENMINMKLLTDLQAKFDIEQHTNNEQKVLVAQLQNELNSMRKAERDLEHTNSQLQSKYEIQTKDLAILHEGKEELKKQLHDLGEKNHKTSTRHNELKAECKRLHQIATEVSSKLEQSEVYNQELRGKFATVGEQMEVMLATEAKDTNEAIFALQSRCTALKQKSVEKVKMFKQTEKALRLELGNALEQIENGRGGATILAEQVSIGIVTLATHHLNPISISPLPPHRTKS